MPQIAAAIPAWVMWVIFAVNTTYQYHDARRKKRNAERESKAAYNASLEDRLVMASLADGKRSRIYGTCRNVDGVLFKGTHGDHSKFYTMVVALAGHECEAIDDVYFNDDKLTLESDGAGGFWVTNSKYRSSAVIAAEQGAVHLGGGTWGATLAHTPIAGSVFFRRRGSRGSTPLAPASVVGDVVTSTNMGGAGNVWVTYQYTEGAKRARVWKYLGTDGQTVGADLLASRFPAMVDSSDRFAGVCCLVVELEYDSDVFSMGLPNVSAVVAGAKVFDPRTGNTSFSYNPALIARDWAMHANGGACTEDEIDEGDFIAAANACEVTTVFDTADGDITLPLYQCNIVLDLTRSPETHLSEIVESMAGRWGWASGALKIVAGVYRAPVADVDENWVAFPEGEGASAEQISILPSPPRAEVVNVFRPTIANAAHDYTSAPLPEVRSDTYIDADGQELPIETTLGGVADHIHAQHVCGVMMRDARDSLTLQLPCNFMAWQLELFDTVTVTLPYFGFDAKEFEVLGWKFSMTNGVMLTLKETGASIYDPDSGFENSNAIANTSFVTPWVVPSITGLSASSDVVVLGDGTPQTRVRVTWDAVTGESVRNSGKVEVQYVENDDSSDFETGWHSAYEEGASTGTTIAGLRQGSYYFFRVRAVNSLRVRGAWSVPIVELIEDAPNEAAATAQAAADAAQATANSALTQLNNIASDGLLTPDEKPRVIMDRDVILAEKAGIDANATALGLTSLRTAYDDAIAELVAYLATLTEAVAWDSLAGNTTIVGVTFRTKFKSVYDARQSLLNAIAVTLAAGSVGTAHLALNAAQIPGLSTSTSGVMDYPVGGDGGGVCDFTHYNLTSESQIVRAEYSVRAFTTISGAWTGETSIRYRRVVWDQVIGNPAVMTEVDAPLLTSTETEYSFVDHIDLPAGSLVVFAFLSRATPTGPTGGGNAAHVHHRSAVLRVTAIKR